VPAIDTPELDMRDIDHLRRASQRARQFGFKAKFAIHPVQIHTIHEVFESESGEREWAEKVLHLYGEAVSEGRGVAMLEGRMIDAATVVMARRLLARPNHQ
jgi:citrate lyase beta subunit